MTNLVLTLGLYQGSGGPSKSIRAMQRALDADVISWVDPVQAASDRLIWDQTARVEGSSLPVLRQLLYPAKGQTNKAEAILAGASLVSCHSPWRWHNLWLRKMARKHGLPYWFVPHGGLDPYVFEEQAPIKKAFLRFGGRRFLEEAACVIFTAKAERDKALRICQPKRSEVVYWPLAEADFLVHRDAERRAKQRTILGIPAQAPCLLYFGRLHPMKRPLETIDAVARAGGDVHLIVIGNAFGVTEADCRERAHQMGVADRVHVVGPVYGEAKADYLAAADAYISLSRRENFNFTAAESMASGLPIILSAGNDLGGELGDTNCVWILEDDRPESAVKGVRQFVDAGVSTREAMGANGRSWAEANLKFDVFAQKIQSLAGELVGNG